MREDISFTHFQDRLKMCSTDAYEQAHQSGCFMGFLVIGTPKGEIPQKPRRPYTDFCEEWTQPLI